MNLNQVLDKLMSNGLEVYKTAAEYLTRIGQNIIKNPNNPKYRCLSKQNAIISQKIIAFEGGLECLKLMGFEENNNNNSLLMPQTYPTTNIQEFCNLLESKIANNTQTNTKSVAIPNSLSTNKCISMEENKRFKPIQLPPLVHLFTNPFLKQIETIFNSVLMYEDKDAQEYAKSLIPLTNLEIQARNDLYEIQLKIKTEKSQKHAELTIQDTLIIELLLWFKNEFFTWINSPTCDNCGSDETAYSHMSENPKDLIYTNRVEVHRCKNCKNFTNFPRYNDLNILLRTRRGRCGEWASVFTLFCRALGWDTRYVHDTTDHVWTEVYSIGRERWIHCDPCENTCDVPLTYEVGWKKQLSYIIAYSVDEVQDVTWRYSCNHKQLLKRRTKCTENELINALITLRNNRQTNYSQTKKVYLTKRLLFEMSEFLVENKPTEYEQTGRISGSLDWRLGRGETHQIESMIWRITDDHLLTNQLILKYSTAHDRYVYDVGTKLAIVDKWKSGIYNFSNIFKKVENDWKVVYLARTEGENVGFVSWKFELASNSKVIDKILLKFHHQTFEDGEIDVRICSEKISINYPKGVDLFETEQFSGLKTFQIVATLTKGKGNVAWQHAQLFRQALNSEDFPFIVQLQFKNQ